MPLPRQPGEPLPAPYSSAAAAVGAEMARIALRVRRALHEAKNASRALGAGPYDGTQADRELSRLEHPPGRAPRIVDDELGAIEARLRERAERNARDRGETRIELPLYRLAQRAGLTELGLDLFLLAMAPEIDEGFGRVFQLLRGGNRRQLDVATAARILTPDDVGAASVRLLLSGKGPLCSLGLLDLAPGDGSRGPAALSITTSLQVHPAVIAHVLGHPAEDAALRLFVATDQPAWPRERTFLPAEVFERATAALEDRGAVLCLEGPAGVGKRSLLRTLCAEQGRALVEVDVRSAPEGLSAAEVLGIVRLAWLRDAMVLLFLPSQVTGATGDGMADIIARHPGPVALCRDAPAGQDASHNDLRVPPWRRIAPLVLPPPDVATREALWRDRLGLGDGQSQAVDLSLLARTYPLTAGTITRIVREARIRAGADIDQKDVRGGIEAEFRPLLQTLGRRLEAKAGLSDLVLQDETRETLLELAATIRLRYQVLSEWGFERLLRGRGVSALFYGEPGTGKTLCAGVIAAACGLSCYQIDTASVVSKWIGETEKNLSAVFRAAEGGHAMLLFDEADAIFGKRTDVQHATDRFANMQTNFLLTQIETFNGVVVLTTNRESVMDPAFQRRLSFRVHFPMPEEKEREELWRRMLAGHPQAVAAEGIACAELAKRLRMSGGYIRNAVLRGAYLAAASGAPLDTRLLRTAAELVLRDAGRII